MDNSDLRYAGLTPAQWIMLGMFALGAWLVWRLRGPVQPPASIAS
jgi:hypothetical protein